ncbi:MAG TPA: TA system VapC family ribonuclease toxin [Pirellulales bacterium]|nr:TA system VapC family ribonuclease toxin [Pirellulales bacterium]
MANESGCLVDSNIWIALSFSSHPGHQVASSAMAAADNRPAFFCRATRQSFLRLVSTPALARQYAAVELTNNDALDLFDRFMAAPYVEYCDEPAGLLALWRQLAGRASAAPKAWMDAYLAAYAIAGGMKFITLDRDFAAFQNAGLKLLTLQAS